MLELESLYISEPRDILIEGLQNDATSAYINNATVTGQVRTSGDSITAGNRIGSTFTLSYITSSDGNYRGTFSAADAASLVEDTTYWLWVSASNYTLRRIPCKATYREKT